MWGCFMMTMKGTRGVNSIPRVETLRQWTNKTITPMIRKSVGLTMFTAVFESAIRKSAIEHAQFAHVEFDIVTEDGLDTFKTLVRNAGFNILSSDVTELENGSERLVMDVEFLEVYNNSNPYSAAILGIGPSEARRIVRDQLRGDAIELISTSIIPEAIKAADRHDCDLLYTFKASPLFAEEVASILRNRGFEVGVRYFYDEECEQVVPLHYTDLPKVAGLYITWL